MKTRPPASVRPQITDDKIVPFEGNVGQQLELFTSVAEEGYSHTIEFWDFVPRFLFERRTSTTVSTHTRDFIFRKQEFTVTVTPAVIGNKAVYASEREELVEQAVRKIAADDAGALTAREDRAGKVMFCVLFTLSRLRRELRSHGHEFKLSEIRAALEILSKTHLDIRRQKGNQRVGGASAPVFPTLAFDYRMDDVDGSQSFVQVGLHPLVQTSILHSAFRLINYTRLMSVRLPLGRWLYMRISHLFSQATKCSWLHDTGYTISLQTILRESGMPRYKDLRGNLRTVKRALNEMEKRGVLHRLRPFVVKLKRENPSGGGRPRLIDAIYTLYPSDEVVEDIIRANIKAKEVRSNTTLALGGG